jgi:hypothetical protein
MLEFLQRLRVLSEQRRRASASETELQSAFKARGLNFMDLDPVIHGALLREALLHGAGNAVSTFVEITGEVEGDNDLSVAQKAAMLVDTYRERGQSFGAVMPSR